MAHLRSGKAKGLGLVSGVSPIIVLEGRPLIARNFHRESKDPVYPFLEGRIFMARLSFQPHLCMRMSSDTTDTLMGLVVCFYQS